MYAASQSDGERERILINYSAKSPKTWEVGDALTQAGDGAQIG